MSHNKAKSKKSVTRRFKVSATGKIIRRQAFGRHLRRTKSGSQSRRQRQNRVVTGRIARRVRRLMAQA